MKKGISTNPKNFDVLRNEFSTKLFCFSFDADCEMDSYFAGFVIPPNT